MVTLEYKPTTEKTATMAITERSLSHIVFLLPTLTASVVYVSTTSSSIAGGDAGELAAEGCQLGTAHPPGYPLYTLLVGLVVRLAAKINTFWLDPPAYWINVTSCAFGSVAAGLISSVIFKLTQEPNNDVTLSVQMLKAACAVSSSILWAFSPLNWQYNKEAEVFALHNLFVSTILYILTVYGERIAFAKTSAKAEFDKSDESIVIIGAFVCALSLTNQHTSVLLIIPVTAYVCHQSSVLTRPMLLMMSTVAFLIGLSPYIALPILASIHPHAGSWGDVSSIPGFIHHLLRRDYGTMQLFSGDDSGSEGMLVRTTSWAHDFVNNQLCHPLTVGFLLLGIYNQLKEVFKYSKSTNRRQTRKTSKRRKPNTIDTNVQNSTGRVMIFALSFYLGVFHSLSNLPLSNPLLYGIHQVSAYTSTIIALVKAQLMEFDLAAEILDAPKYLRIYFFGCRNA